MVDVLNNNSHRHGCWCFVFVVELNSKISMINRLKRMIYSVWHWRAWHSKAAKLAQIRGFVNWHQKWWNRFSSEIIIFVAPENAFKLFRIWIMGTFKKHRLVMIMFEFQNFKGKWNERLIDKRTKMNRLSQYWDWQLSGLKMRSSKIGIIQ